MIAVKKFLLLVGRLFLSSIFILSALNKVFEWQKTQTGLINLFCDWQSYVNFSPILAKFFAFLISWSPEILIAITIFELLASLLVFFGIKEKFGAFILILFFAPATFLLHPFWFLNGMKRTLEMVLFLKNIAILGGLLFLMVFGSKVKKESIVGNFESEEQVDEG